MKTKRLKIWRVAAGQWEHQFGGDIRNIPGMPADAVQVASSIHAYWTDDIAVKVASAAFEEVPKGVLIPVNEDFATGNADTPLVVGG